MKQVSFLVLLVLFTGSLQAQSPTYCQQNGVAIKGYDVVAYFKDHAAIAGIQQYNYSWQGTEWHFKNQANLDSFKTNPNKYAPQFGGYCAYGVSQDHKSPTDPAAFTIIDEKLYLNYNNKVKEIWIKDTKANIEKAGINWQILKNKN